MNGRVQVKVIKGFDWTTTQELRILHTSSGIEIGEYGGGDEENERNSGSQNMVWRNKVIY
jgi:hypothetical protein